jgi:DivIVA domain-containing protein
MLTVDDVRDKTFTTTRLREGYEIAEVDGFRSDVAEAITIRDAVISQLRDELATTRVQALEARADGDHFSDRTDESSDRAESSAAAVRLLEMATANADQLVAEAQAEAEVILSAARHESDELLSASRSEAERGTAELERTKRQQTAELEQHRRSVLAELADAKASLEAKIHHLSQQESEHRDHLRRHFAEQLARLEEPAPGPLRAVVAD